MIPHMKLKNQQSEVFKVMTGFTLEGVGGGGVWRGTQREHGFWSTNNLSFNQGSGYMGVFKNSTIMCALFWTIILLIKIGKR